MAPPSPPSVGPILLPSQYCQQRPERLNKQPLQHPPKNLKAFYKFITILGQRARSQDTSYNDPLSASIKLQHRYWLSDLLQCERILIPKNTDDRHPVALNYTPANWCCVFPCDSERGRRFAAAEQFHQELATHYEVQVTLSSAAELLHHLLDKVHPEERHYACVAAAWRLGTGNRGIAVFGLRGLYDIMSTSSGTPESWISSFCSLLGHEYFAEISEEFVEDDFNLTGLQTQVAMYKEALEMILDVEPEEEDDEEEEEEEEDDDNSVEGVTRRPLSDRRHHRMASDLSIIESSAEMLYGLIHQRFICSRSGIQQMSEKYELAHFGYCPRTNCEGTKTLPVGLSDVPGEDTVKLFCPSCLDVYVPPNSRFQTVDGAFFGRTFGALFLMTFPEYDVSKKATEALTGTHPRAVQLSVPTDQDDKEKINGMNVYNLGPGLGKDKMYHAKIYGFLVAERARSGPRMGWLRDRPANLKDLDEAATFNAEHPDFSDEEADTPTRMPAPRKTRRVNGGSPMSVQENGEL